MSEDERIVMNPVGVVRKMRRAEPDATEELGT